MTYMCADRFCVARSQHQLDDYIEDLIIARYSRPDVAELCLPQLRASTTAKIAYYGHDLHFNRLKAGSRLTGNAMQRRAAGMHSGGPVAFALEPAAEEFAIQAFVVNDQDPAFRGRDGRRDARRFSWVRSAPYPSLRAMGAMTVSEV